MIIAGDLNVAVQDVDIFKPSARKVPGSTVEERNSVNSTLNSLGLVDVYRAVNPTVAECYTFFAPRSNAKKTGSAWYDTSCASDSIVQRTKSGFVCFCVKVIPINCFSGVSTIF